MPDTTTYILDNSKISNHSFFFFFLRKGLRLATIVSLCKSISSTVCNYTTLTQRLWPAFCNKERRENKTNFFFTYAIEWLMEILKWIHKVIKQYKINTSAITVKQIVKVLSFLLSILYTNEWFFHYIWFV